MTLSVFNGQGVPHAPVAAKSYYDGSGGSKDGHLTLAGYSATPACWAEFEQAWPGILAGGERRPSCRYLHMKELNARVDEFAGWTDPQAWDLLRDAMNLMLALASKHEGQFYGTVCTIDLGDYERAREDCPALHQWSPHRICAYWVVPETFHLLQPHPHDPTKPFGTVELVFDRNEGFYHHLYQLWNKPYRKRPPKLRHVSSLIQADMERVAPLQAADFLAWLTNRYATQGYLLHQAMRVFTVPAREKKFDYKSLVETYGPKTSQ